MKLKRLIQGKDAIMARREEIAQVKSTAQCFK